MNLFHYLKLALGVVLTFVGVKLLLAQTAWKIDTFPALLVVTSVLIISIVASVVRNRRERREQARRQLSLNHSLTNANRFGVPAKRTAVVAR
jgi:predicted tellurium resistance membrane protein TerC